MSPFLCRSATIQCCHGGVALPSPGNHQVKAGASQILVETDATLVAGCPFNVGGKPSPCVRITWRSPADKVRLAAGRPLTRASIGQCYNAEGLVQGLAIVAACQSNASAR